MKKYIPDSLALFRIFSAPVILYLLVLLILKELVFGLQFYLLLESLLLLD